jgi:hypothetical protein
MSDRGQVRHHDYHGWARRIDLVLRTRYPNLTTRIFELQPNQYVITFSKDLLDAVAIKNEFEDGIRFMTTNIVVSNDVPQAFSRELSPISDDEIAKGYAGMPMTLPELGNLIASRFPNLAILSVRDGGTPMVVTVDLGAPLVPEEEQELLGFCLGLEAIVPWQLNVVPKDQIPNIRKERTVQAPGMKMPFPAPDPLAVRATRRRPYLPQYAKEDEAFWFENIDAIFAGRVSAKNVPGVLQNQSQCFMDLTVGDHVNLRQALLLYDTVYVSPPLAEGFEQFLQRQQVSESDLLTLVELGRVKIVMTQADERLNLKFLEAVSERHPTAIIGRRSTAALLIADLVQTADEYRLAKPDARYGVAELAKFFTKLTNIPHDEVMRLLLWPIEARRAALQPLLDRGSKGIAPVGLAPFLARNIKRVTNKDLELESLVVSERVHIGHALNATVFPNLYEPGGLILLMNAMADGLNFFRSFNTRVAASWAANEDRKFARKSVMPAIPLFEFEPGVPINEFLDSVSFSSTRNKGNALFGRLADMPDEQRTAEVVRLQTELRKRFKARDTVLSFENLADTGASIGGILFPFTYWPLAGLNAIGNQLKEAVRNIPAMDRLIADIERDLYSALGKNQEIDFLSRINRVATLKKDRIS